MKKAVCEKAAGTSVACRGAPLAATHWLDCFPGFLTVVVANAFVFCSLSLPFGPDVEC